MGLGGGNIQVKGRGEQMFFLMINWRGGDKSNPWTKSIGPWTGPTWTSLV